MAWFIYSVALPLGALILGIAGVVLYWSIKTSAFNPVAKTSHSLLGEEAVPQPASSASGPSRR